MSDIAVLVESLKKGGNPIIDMHQARIREIQYKYRRKTHVPARNILDNMDSLVEPFCIGLDEGQKLEIVSSGYEVFNSLYKPGGNFPEEKARKQILETARIRAGEMIHREKTINSLFHELMPYVKEAVEPYKDTPLGLDYNDLMQIGYKTLMLVLRSKTYFRKTTLEREVTAEVSTRLKITLASELNYQNTHRHNHNVNMIEDEEHGVYQEIDDKERTAAIEMALGKLGNIKQRDIITKRCLENKTLDEVGKEFYLTRERIRQLEARALRKLRHPSRLKILADFAPENYIGKSKRSRVRKVEPSLNELMSKIEADIGQLTGDSLAEFRARYDITRDDLVAILQELYPALEKSSKLALVNLSESEMEYVLDNSRFFAGQYENLDQVKATLAQLESRKGNMTRKQETDVRMILRDNYFPLFVSDRVRCFAVLKEEVGSPDNPEQLRELYRETLEHFEKVLDISVGGVKSTLDNYQKVDLSILREHDAFVIASEMGTGKSLEAICYALSKGAQRVLIVSTQSGIYSTWPSELRKHLVGDTSCSILNGNLLRGKTIPESRWNLATYATAQQNIEKLEAMGFDMVVLDECHKMNHDNSLQSRRIRRLNPKYKLAISGSLFKNRRSELFAILNWLFPEKFYSKSRFSQEYSVSDVGLYRLQYELRNRLICRFKSQVLSLPDVKHVHEKVYFTDEQREVYQAVESDFVKWYVEQFKTNPVTGSIILSKIHALRKKAIQAKYPLLDEVLEQVIAQDGNKAVVYTTYREVVEKLQRLYGNKYGVCAITGFTSGPERVRQIGEFNDRPDKRLFIVTAAGGESIDLSRHNCLIYMNDPLTYADKKQVLDRFHRREQRQQVQAFHLTTVGSVDERIDKLIDKKRQEYQRTVHDAFYYPNEIQDDMEHNIRELASELVRQPL